MCQFNTRRLEDPIRWLDHSGVCGPASGLLAHGAGALAATAVLEDRLPREVVKITLVFVGLLLGSWFSLAIVGLLLGFWRVAQEPWRPLLLFLAIVGLLLGSWRMAQEPWRLFRHQQDRPGLCCALFSRCASKLLFFTKTMNQDHQWANARYSGAFHSVGCRVLSACPTGQPLC